MLKAPAVGGGRLPGRDGPAGRRRPLGLRRRAATTCSSSNLTSGEVEQAVAGRRGPVHAGAAGRARRLYVTNWGGDPPGEGRPAGHDLRHARPHRPADRRRQPRQRLGRARRRPTAGSRRRRSRSACTRAAWPRARRASSSTSPTPTATPSASSTRETRRGRRDDRLPAGGRLPFGSGSQRPGPQPRRRHAVRRQRHQQLRRRRPPRPSAPDGDGPAGRRGEPVAGLIPTGWYPGAVPLSADGKRLFVANVKGARLARASRGPRAEGQELARPPRLRVDHRRARRRRSSAKYTADGQRQQPPRLQPRRPGEAAAGREAGARSRSGTASRRVFEHVIYVIKENRTYDQVFGDMKEGNGDPKPVHLRRGGDAEPPRAGPRVRPARQLLLQRRASAPTATRGSTRPTSPTTWRSRSAASRAATPTRASDPLAFAASGFLWDNALAARRPSATTASSSKTTYAPKAPTWADVYADYTNGTGKVKVDGHAERRDRCEPYTHPDYPGFPLIDAGRLPGEAVHRRAEGVRAEGRRSRTWCTCSCRATTPAAPARTRRRRGRWSPTTTWRWAGSSRRSRKSKFWPKTCIFVVEDDPQNGFDHVDGHRTVGAGHQPVHASASPSTRPATTRRAWSRRSS